MSSRSSGPGRNPAAIALFALLACTAIAVIFTASAHAELSQVAQTNGSPLMTGGWAKGNQTETFVWNERGSGIRFERIRIDGAERWKIDHQATGECDTDASASNGPYARVFQPCPNAVGINRAYTFSTASRNAVPILTV